MIHAISLYRHVIYSNPGANILLFADNGKFFRQKCNDFEHHYHSLLQIIFAIQKHTNMWAICTKSHKNSDYPYCLNGEAAPVTIRADKSSTS